MVDQLQVACDMHYRRFYALQNNGQTISLWRGPHWAMSPVRKVKRLQPAADGHHLQLTDGQMMLGQPLKRLAVQDFDWCWLANGKIRLSPRMVDLSIAGFMRLFPVMHAFLLQAYPVQPVSKIAYQAAVTKMAEALDCLVVAEPDDSELCEADGIRLPHLYLTLARQIDATLPANGLRLHDALLDIVIAVLERYPSQRLLPVPVAGLRSFRDQLTGG